MTSAGTGGKVPGRRRNFLAAAEGIEGVHIGHATDPTGLSGCTVILCPRGCRAGVDVRGSAPGTRETDVLRPGNLVEAVHAVVLAGGSAFGLAAATGVVRYLESLGAGFETPAGRVPIVVGAVLYDLDLGDPRARPDEAAGWAACEAARQTGPIAEGCVGAGTGATVGKLFGPSYRMKAGVGVARGRLSTGHAALAVVAVNAVGDVYDPATGEWVAGAYDRAAARPVVRLARQAGSPFALQSPGPSAGPGQATTLACVVTALPLTGSDLTKVAQMAHDGLARAVRPAHTLWDGDTIFALSAGSGQPYAGRPREVAVSEMGALAADLVAEAIVRAVRQAHGVDGVLAWRDLPRARPG